MKQSRMVALFVLLIIPVFLLSACAGVKKVLLGSTATPTITLTPTRTFTPTSTSTPIPTPTATSLPTPTQMGGGAGSIGLAQTVIQETGYHHAVYAYFYSTYSVDGAQTSESRKIEEDEFYCLLGGCNDYINSYDDKGFNLISSEGSSKYFQSDMLNSSTFPVEEGLNQSIIETSDRTILFVITSSIGHADNSSIFMVDVPNGNVELIAQNLDFSYSDPSGTGISPNLGVNPLIVESADKTVKLLLVSTYGHETDGSIYRIDTEGLNIKLIAEHVDIYPWQTYFSPDNQWFLFQGNWNDEKDFQTYYLLATDGSNPVRELTGIKTWPMWSRNSPYLYWMGDINKKRMSVLPEKTQHQIIQIDPQTLEHKILAEGKNLIGDGDLNNDPHNCFESPVALIFYCNNVSIDLTQNPPVIKGYIDDFPVVKNETPWLEHYWLSPDENKAVMIIAGRHGPLVYVADLITGNTYLVEGFFLTQTSPNPWSPDSRLIIGMETDYPKSVDEVGQDNRPTHLFIFDIEKKAIISTIPIEADGELYPIWLN